MTRDERRLYLEVLAGILRPEKDVRVNVRNTDHDVSLTLAKYDDHYHPPWTICMSTFLFLILKEECIFIHGRELKSPYTFVNDSLSDATEVYKKLAIEQGLLQGDEDD